MHLGKEQSTGIAADLEDPAVAPPEAAPDTTQQPAPPVTAEEASTTAAR